jgi:hypothetical protein
VAAGAFPLAGPPGVQPTPARHRTGGRPYDLWLDCRSHRDIAEIIGKEFPAFGDLPHNDPAASALSMSRAFLVAAVGSNLILGLFASWPVNLGLALDEHRHPGRRQHFDIWQSRALGAGCGRLARGVSRASHQAGSFST